MTDQPVEPTPAEAAAAKLAELGEAYKQSQAPRGDAIDRAMAGILEDKFFQDRDHVDNIETAKLLRAGGVDDPAVIRQVLSDGPVAEAEFDAAKSQRDRLLRDHDFQKRYLSGDGEAVRTMTLLNVILTRDVKKGAAA